jgi:AcrR family transcriptional regulator
MTKDEVVAKLLEVFRRDGYDGASLAELSKRTGLGKSSLYHYFPGGKVDMALAVLEVAGKWIEANIAGAVRGHGSPAERLDRVLQAISAFYEDGTKACLLERLCASVDRRRFEAALRGVLSAWVGALAGLGAEAGVPAAEARARAEDAVSRIQGSLVLSVGLDDPGVFRRAIEAVRKTLLLPAAGARGRRGPARRAPRPR